MASDEELVGDVADGSEPALEELLGVVSVDDVLDVVSAAFPARRVTPTVRTEGIDDHALPAVFASVPDPVG